MIQEVADLYQAPGMLSDSEVDFLYRLGRLNHCRGAIVEIGSFKGKSTIALARGAAAADRALVYAIDPHRIKPEEGIWKIPKRSFSPTLRMPE